MDMEKERPQEVSLGGHDSDLSATIPPLQRKSSLVPWNTILEMRQVAANKRKQEEIRSKIHNNWLVRETQKMWFKSLAHLIFGINKTSPLGVRSRMIHPDSSFCIFVVAVSVVLLLYLALVVQVEVGFFWSADLCTGALPTEPFDLFVDAWFLSEIILTFFVGVHKDGVYYDDYRVVARLHIRSGGFFFDLATSIPETMIERALRGIYCSEGSGKPLDDILPLRIVQVLRPIRVFRIFRILNMRKKIEALERVINVSVFLDSLRIPSFVTRMLWNFWWMFFVVHTATCLFWLSKEFSCSESEIESWLEDKLINEESKHHLGHQASLVQRYILAFYFVNTMFTTIGFGDLVPVNDAERVTVVLLMYIGVLVFGFLLAEVTDIANDALVHRRQRAKMRVLTRAFLSTNEVPANLSEKVVRWVDSANELRQRRELQDTVLGNVPLVMRRLIFSHLHNGMLANVPFLGGIHHFHREDFLVDLFARMQPEAFPKWLPINAAHGEEADGLVCITHGVFSVECHGQIVCSLQPGHFFGDLSLLVPHSWSTSDGVPAKYICETFVEILFLSKDDFDQSVSTCPESLQALIKHIRKDTIESFQASRASLETMSTRQQINTARWRCIIQKATRVLRSGWSFSGKTVDHLTSRQELGLIDAVQKMSFSVKVSEVNSSLADQLEMNPPSRGASLQRQKSFLYGQGSEQSMISLGPVTKKCTRSVSRQDSDVIQQSPQDVNMPGTNNQSDYDVGVAVELGDASEDARKSGEGPDGDDKFNLLMTRLGDILVSLARSRYNLMLIACAQHQRTHIFPSADALQVSMMQQQKDVLLELQALRSAVDLATSSSMFPPGEERHLARSMRLAFPMSAGGDAVQEGEGTQGTLAEEMPPSVPTRLARWSPRSEERLRLAAHRVAHRTIYSI